MFWFKAVSQLSRSHTHTRSHTQPVKNELWYINSWKFVLFCFSWFVDVGAFISLLRTSGAFLYIGCLRNACFMSFLLKMCGVQFIEMWSGRYTKRCSSGKKTNQQTLRCVTSYWIVGVHELKCDKKVCVGMVKNKLSTHLLCSWSIINVNWYNFVPFAEPKQKENEKKGKNTHQHQQQQQHFWSYSWSRFQTYSHKVSHLPVQRSRSRY